MNDTATPLRRGRIFIVTLLALFTAGAAVSLRAVTAVHMRTDYLDAIDKVRAGEMLGTVLGAAFIGFALTLFFVSPVLAAIGFRRALIAAATLLVAGFVLVGHAASLGVSPYTGLLIGMVVQGLGWGLVETVINPLTSALYPDDRVGRLGILHAWYPAGVVGGALIGLTADGAGWPWRFEFVIVGAFALLFAGLAWIETFPPVSASTDAPVSPGEMIRATLHSPALIFWVVLMMFTASAEFAPGQWVDVALSQIVGMRGIWLLVFVSALMFMLRHFAGPLAHRFGNIGLLIFSSVFATLGLYALSFANSPTTALLAAVLWGLGVAYFWPTMLATVAERYPRSGTIVFGTMGAAGAASTFVVLPYIGALSDKAKLAAASQGETAGQILQTAATVSFQTIALIPLCLIVIFIGIAVADRMRKKA
ncbi:MAG: transporter [Alphaproteobacteria bacterium]|nr:transporter [Alphaproteobacteria bacterium]